MKKTQLAPLVLALYGCAASTAAPAAAPSVPAEAPLSAENSAPPPATEPAAPNAAANATPVQDPVQALGEGVAHHALVQKQLGFYAVITPPGYDAPENKNKRYPVVVVLHSSGADELASGKLATELGRDGVIYVLPRAPYTQGEALAATAADADQSGYTAWPSYPSEWGQFEGEKFPTAEIKKLQVPRMYTDWIAETIKDARKRYRTSADRAVLVGEGQGAAFAHLFAAQHPLMVKAYFAYAGYYDDTTGSKDGRSHATALKDNKIKVLLVHYADDPVVKSEQTTKLDAFLTERKVEHSIKLLPGKSHELTPEVTEEAHVFVRQWCCGEKPVTAAPVVAAPVAPSPAAPAAATPAPATPAPSPAVAPAAAGPVAAKPAAPAATPKVASKPTAPSAAPNTAVAVAPPAAAPAAAPSVSPQAAPAKPKTTVEAATVQAAPGAAAKNAPAAKPKDVPAVVVVPPKSAPAAAKPEVKTAAAAPVKEAPVKDAPVKEAAAPGTKAKEAPTSSDTASKLKDATKGGSTPKTASESGKKEADPAKGTAKTADPASEKAKTAGPSTPVPVKTDKPEPQKAATPAKAPSVTPAAPTPATP